jgi:hypothetical protein
MNNFWKKARNSTIMVVLFLGFLLISSLIVEPKANFELVTENQKLIQKYDSLRHLISDIELTVLTFDLQENKDMYRLLKIPKREVPMVFYEFDSTEIRADSLISNLESRLKIIKKNMINYQEARIEQAEIVKKKIDSLKHTPLIKPVNNAEIIEITCGYGYQIHPYYNRIFFHEGIDFSIEVGKSIFATAKGEVELIKKDRYGYGYRVVINHGYGYKTVYAHLSEFLVNKGDKVKRGQEIAKSGNSGLSTGPHLHYEVHMNGQPVNPSWFYTTNDFIARK